MERLKKSEELMQELDKHTLTAFYPAGTRILGKDIKAMPIVISGLLKIMQSEVGDNNILLYYVKPNEACVVSMMHGIPFKNCNIIVQIEEDAEIMFVPQEKAMLWMNLYPEWTEFVMHSYHSRFDELLKALNSASAEKLETRILKYLRQRRSLYENKVLSITHQNMASDLATNRVVISRLLKTLENKGLVKLGRNKIEVAESL